MIFLGKNNIFITKKLTYFLKNNNNDKLKKYLIYELDKTNNKKIKILLNCIIKNIDINLNKINLIKLNNNSYKYIKY